MIKKLDKPISRELPREIDRSEWIVTIDSVGVTLRRKRCRQEKYTLTWEYIWRRAMDLAVEVRRRDRRGVAGAGRALDWECLQQEREARFFT